MLKSEKLFERACAVIPGGVNSPVRSFGSVGGNPVFMESGSGSKIYSADGKEYVDFCCSWGPLILGHAHPSVVESICKAAEKGTSFGANTEGEVELAELVCNQIPSAEMVRLMSSGTEAVMTALRLARGYTGRTKIIKFDGCYHGHADYLLVAAGSGLLTSGNPTSAGVTRAITDDVLIAPYNDIAAVEQLVSEHGDEIAAIIVEPIAGNMGLVMPENGFLEGLRSVCDKNSSLLLFDEVITGFRLGSTTYGTICGVTPDLTTLGKIIGGGMPIGAVTGKAEIMKHLAPLGDVYQAGTLSGNPVAVAAGLATIRELIETNPYPEMDKLASYIGEEINQYVEANGGQIHCATKGGMFTTFFTGDSVTNLAEAKTCDTKAHAAFFHGMLEQGIYLPPSQFEVCFVSAAHTQQDVEKMLDAVGFLDT